MCYLTRAGSLFLGALAMLLALASYAQAAPKVQTFALSETKEVVLQNVKAEAVEYKGRKALRLTKESEDGFALLPGTDFQDGTIEADIALKVTVPPGVRMPGFIGIAFRARPDVSFTNSSTFDRETLSLKTRLCGTILCNTALSRTSTGTGCVASGLSSTRPMRNCSRRAGLR